MYVCIWEYILYIQIQVASQRRSTLDNYPAEYAKMHLIEDEAAGRDEEQTTRP